VTDDAFAIASPPAADFSHDGIGCRVKHGSAYRTTDIVDHHLCAATRKQQRMFAAQAAASPRHHSDSSSQVNFHAGLIDSRNSAYQSITSRARQQKLRILLDLTPPLRNA